MDATIYKIINDLNDKIYVGQTWQTIEERFKRHCAEARWENTKKMPIVLAIKKYGHCHFQIIELEKLIAPTQEYVDQREVHWAKVLNSLAPNGYNLKVGGAAGLLSEITKKRISEGNKGKKASPETKEKLRLSHMGHVVKESTKKKLSEINTGKVLSYDHKEKISRSNFGKTRTALQRSRMSIAKIKYEYRIIAPTGDVFITNNLTQFSKDNHLNKGHMGSVASGRKSHYKGWKVETKSSLQKLNSA